MNVGVGRIDVDADDVRVVRLGPVVIVRGNPEDRNHGLAERGLESLGQADGCERLVEVVERPPEQRRLLTGGDHVTAELDEALQARRIGSRGDDERLHGSLPSRSVEAAVDLCGLGLEVLGACEAAREKRPHRRLPRQVVPDHRGTLRTTNDQFHRVSLCGRARHGQSCPRGTVAPPERGERPRAVGSWQTAIVVSGL